MSHRNELTIRGDPAALARFVQVVEASLADGWKRDQALEERARENGLGRTGARCFSCRAEGTRPAAAVWLVPRGPDELHASNVVPLETTRWDQEKRDRILEEFERTFAAPAMALADVTVRLAPERATPERALAADAARRFRAFLEAAPTPALRREDWRRWQAFVIQAHRDGTVVEEEDLDRWLGEAGWPDEPRRQLTSAFYAGRSLLQAYDEEILASWPP
jgi:hypothetical protein